MKGLVARWSRDPARVAIVPLLEARTGTRSDGHAHGHAHRAHTTPGGQRRHAARRVLVLLTGTRHREARHRRHWTVMPKRNDMTRCINAIVSSFTVKCKSFS